MSVVLVACAAYQAGRAVSEFGEGDRVQGWLSVLLVALYGGMAWRLA